MASNSQVSNMSQSHQAVCILIDQGHSTSPRYKLDKGALERVIKNAKLASHTKIITLSVAGKFRSGKSFLLTLLGRYFNLEQPGSGVRDSWWTDITHDINVFKWRGGDDRCTSGIWIWSRPFRIATDSALFLIDTEGLFEKSADNTQMLTLSLYLSSLQVVNLTSQLEELSLQSIATTAEFAARVNASQNGDTNHKIFPEFVFLIRDWEKHTSFPFGWDGGADYWRKYFQPNVRTTQASVQCGQSISRSFQKVRCFLMPRPGDEVCELGDPLPVSQIDVEKRFKTQFSEFCIHLFSDEILPVKRGFDNQPLTTKEYPDYAADILNFVCNCPKPETQLRAFLSLQARTAAKKALERFAAAMAKGKEIKSESEFYERLKRSFNEANEYFAKETSALDCNEEREKFQRLIKRRSEFMKDIVECTREMLVYRWKKGSNQLTNQILKQSIDRIQESDMEGREEILPIMTNFLTTWLQRAQDLLRQITEHCSERGKAWESRLKQLETNVQFLALKHEISNDQNELYHSLVVRNSFFQEYTLFRDFIYVMITKNIRDADKQWNTTGHSRIFTLINRKKNELEDDFQDHIKEKEIDITKMKASEWKEFLENEKQRTTQIFKTCIRSLDEHDEEVESDQMSTLERYLQEQVNDWVITHKERNGWSETLTSGTLWGSAILGTVVGGIIGSIVPGVGTVLGATLGAMLFGGTGTAIDRSNRHDL